MALRLKKSEQHGRQRKNAPGTGLSRARCSSTLGPRPSPKSSELHGPKPQKSGFSPGDGANRERVRPRAPHLPRSGGPGLPRARGASTGDAVGFSRSPAARPREPGREGRLKNRWRPPEKAHRSLGGFLMCVWARSPHVGPSSVRRVEYPRLSRGVAAGAPRNIHVAAAASPRPVPTDNPRRGPGRRPRRRGARTETGRDAAAAGRQPAGRYEKVGESRDIPAT